MRPGVSTCAQHGAAHTHTHKNYISQKNLGNAEKGLLTAGKIPPNPFECIRFQLGLLFLRPLLHHGVCLKLPLTHGFLKRNRFCDGCVWSRHLYTTGSVALLFFCAKLEELGQAVEEGTHLPSMYHRCWRANSRTSKGVGSIFLCSTPFRPGPCWSHAPKYA